MCHGAYLPQVIEKRNGAGEGSEQEQVKGRITAQLEATNERIKLLESRLEQLKGDLNHC